ncbi:MAG: histidinol dehydrogenase [Bacteroidota bacterium]
MTIYNNPPKQQWSNLLQRPDLDQGNLLSNVRELLEQVRLEGDQALKQLTWLFDEVQLDDFRVSEAEMEAADQALDPALKSALQVAAENIRAFHQTQIGRFEKVETSPGVQCWQRETPIDRVGLYIPGGSAPLFSTVLMLGIPAQIAGCQEIVLCSPPDKNGQINPAILYAAQLVGIREIYKLGGVQAVGALAFGTSSILKVEKIFGPGNRYVTAAKQLVQLEGVAIDMPAGPSEVLVVADASTPAAYTAADLLAQAEHGPDSQVILVTNEEDYAKAVEKAVAEQILQLPRADIARQALAHSRSFVLSDWQIAMQLVNSYAPEHLIIATENAHILAEQVRNAGSVFLGAYSPESIGDYASGTNHTLPTNGFAKAYSGVSVGAFVKKITFQELSPSGLQNLGPVVEILAAAEQLEGHKQAVSIRLADLNNNQNVA